MGLAAIRTALAGALSAHPVLLRGYDNLAKPEPPCAVVDLPERIEPNATFMGAWTYTIPVSLIVRRADDRTAVDKLEEYLDKDAGVTVTIQEAVGPWDSLRVVDISQFGVISIAEVDYLGCVLSVEVYA